MFSIINKAFVPWHTLVKLFLCEHATVQLILLCQNHDDKSSQSVYFVTMCLQIIIHTIILKRAITYLYPVELFYSYNPQI